MQGQEGADEKTYLILRSSVLNAAKVGICNEIAIPQTC